MKIIKKFKMIGKHLFKKNFCSSLSFLNESQRSLKELVHKFSKDKIAPIAQEIDKTDRFPREIFPQLGELGLLGITIPS